MPKLRTMLSTLFALLVLPCAALAAEGHPTIPGSELSAVWVIPFACMLLSIAIMPLALPHFWEHHFGKIAVFWGLAFLVPCLIVFGFPVALYEFLHIILLDYIPFIVLLFALFTVAGGGAPERLVGRHAAGEHGHSGSGHRPGQLDGHHRRGHAADPASAARQRPSQIPRAFRGVFHLSGGQHRRLANAARRSAAFPGLSQGRQLFLDHHAPFLENPVSFRSLAGHLLRAGHSAFQQGGPSGSSA